jgi:hypothetical protein
LLLALYAGIDMRLRPAAIPENVADQSFSARRARETLTRLIGDLGPHPAGTAAHDLLRARLVGELQELGLAAEVSEGFALGPYGYAAVARNVIARVPGREEGPAVLLMAHYDSEGQAIGAGDDGSGVAILLESARALLSGTPPARPVILLFSDAEEAGLVGAVSFCDDHRWFEDVAVAVNAEARGTAGRSLMFQTFGANRWLVDALGSSAPRPWASSVSDLVYKSMPNDTDLTVLGKRGVPGLNFAFIRGLSRYHTPRDDLEHLSDASVQEQGDNVLGLARALGAALVSDEAPPEGSVVYSDVLGTWILAWPTEWSLPLGALATLLALAGAYRVLHLRTVRPLQLATGLFACLLGPALCMLATWFWLKAASDTSGVADPAVASPGPWAAGLLALNGAVIVIVHGISTRVSGFVGAWVGTWIAASLGALVMARIAPEASNLLICPALAAGLVAWPTGILRPRREAIGIGLISAWLLPLLVTATFWLPLAIGLQHGFGFRSNPMNAASLSAPLAVVGLALAPLLARGRGFALVTASVVCLTAWLLCTGYGLTLPAHTPDDPAWLNVRYILNADEATARWDVSTYGGPVPDELARAADLKPTKEPPFPWLSLDRSLFAGPAPLWDVPAPTFEVTGQEPSDDGRIVTGRIRSPRGATRLHLRLPEQVELVAASWNGHEIRDEFVPRHGHVFCAIPAEDGVMVELSATDREPFDVWLLDQDWTLPPEAQAVLDTRPEHAVQRGDGDVSIIGRSVRVE